MNLPLVSIGIISYNSELFIAECIESCLSQTYPNIEIIIADDASTDRTPSIVRRYCEMHPDRLTFLRSTVNSGVAFNFNQAAKASKGEWFKPIAGDDVLDKNCIEIFLNEIFKQNIKSGILFGRIRAFKNTGTEVYVSTTPSFFDAPLNKRLELLLISNQFPAPGSFINSLTLKNLGFAHERYKFIEDYPLWIKACMAGVPFYAVDSVVVNYRIHDSLSISVHKIGNADYYKSYLLFSREILWPKRKNVAHLMSAQEFIVLNFKLLSIFYFDNKKTTSYRILEKFVKLFMFYSLYEWVKQLIVNVPLKKYLPKPRRP